MSDPIRPNEEHQIARGRVRSLCGAGCVLLAALTILLPGPVSSLVGQNWLVSLATEQLDLSLSRNTAVFAAVSGIKALLGVIDGSTVGLSLGASVELQLGDLVQPVWEYFDFVWDIFLYTLFLLSFYRLLMESGILVLGIAVLFVAAGAFLLADTKGGQARFRARSRSAAVAGALFAFGLPIAVLGSAGLTDLYVGPLRTASWAEAEQQLFELRVIVGELAMVQERVSILRPGESVSEIVAAARALGERASSVAWSTFSSLLYYLAALILELLLLPLSLLLGMRALLKGGTGIPGPVKLGR